MIGNGEDDAKFCYVRVPNDSELVRRVFTSPIEVTDKIEGVYDSYAKISTKDEWLQVRYVPHNSRGFPRWNNPDEFQPSM
jgi:hypothetical protein